MKADDKENDKKDEGLTVDDSYVPSGKNDTPFRNNNNNIRTRMVMHYPPADEPNADNSDAENIPAAIPLIFSVLAIATGLASFYVIHLLSLIGIVLSIVAISLGERIKLTKGKIATMGAMAGIFGLCLNIVSLTLFILFS